MSKKVFLVDVARCNGCHNCQIACKDEHCGASWLPYAAEQPDTGQFWCKVEQGVHGSVPKVNMTYTPKIGDFWFKKAEGKKYHLWFDAADNAAERVAELVADCHTGDTVSANPLGAALSLGKVTEGRKRYLNPVLGK